eukprot:tig00000789_g4125.t1
MLGTWRGQGRGFYPTIKSFDYTEELVIGHGGKPVLSYSQKTWVDGKLMHVESGFIRVPEPPAIEFVVMHANGLGETDEGNIDVAEDGRVVFKIRSTALTRTQSAKAPHVTGVEREFAKKDDNTLVYSVSMSTTTTQHMEKHLEATLKRV